MINNDNIIKSKDNKKFKMFLDVKNNKNKSNLILAEGEDLIDMCISSSSKLIEVISFEYNEKYKDYPQTILSKELYRQLSSYSSLPRSIGICEYALKDTESEKIIYLDGVQDPGNLGTIERTALAFGYRDIVLSSNCVSPFNFKAVQASKGALFKLNISFNSLKYFVDRNFDVYVTCLDGKDISQIEKKKDKFVLVFGNEGQGVSKENLDLACEHVLLPISKEIDSLNVGVAAAIFMYLWSVK